MPEENSKPLYDAISEVNSDAAPEIVKKYEKIKSKILASSGGARATETEMFLSSIADNIIAENKEDRRDLIEFFNDQLDTSLNIGLDDSDSRMKRPEVDFGDVRDPGFAEASRPSEGQELYESFSREQIAEMIRAAGESAEVPEDRKNRLEQLTLTIAAFEGLQEKIRQSSGLGEKLHQLVTPSEETALRADTIDHFIYHLRTVGLRMIGQEGKTVADVFADIRTRNLTDGAGPEAFLKTYDGWEQFFENGKFIDVTTEAGRKAYQLALANFLRENKCYQTLESFIQDEVMAQEFESGRSKLPGLYLDPTEHSETSIQDSLRDKAEEKIGKIFTAEARRNIRKQIVTAAKKSGKEMSGDEIESAIDGYRKSMVALHMHRLEGLYIAEHFMDESADKNPNGITVNPVNKKFWEIYRDTFDPKNETGNVADATWDMMLEELLITAPMVIVSGGVAGAIAKGAEAVVRATRLISLGARLAEGGRMARLAYRVGSLTLRASSLVLEGAVFQTTFLGLNKQWLFDQPDWAKQILWTAGTLGLFKFAGSKGLKWSGQFNRIMKDLAPRFGGNKVVQLINQMLIQGHTQVAAMLFTGFLQNLTAGELDEFIDHFGYELFHAYVSVGALTIAGGVVKTAGGKIFEPRGGKKEQRSEEKTKAEEGKGKADEVSKALSAEPSLRKKFEACKKDCTAVIADILRAIDSGKTDKGTIDAFRAKLAGLGAFLVTMLSASSARASGVIQDLILAIPAAGGGLAALGDVLIGLALLAGGYKNWDSVVRVYDFIVGTPRSRLILSSITGKKGIATRLTGRQGTEAGDNAARDLGKSLRTLLDTLKEGKRISRAIKNGEYDLGPLSEFAKSVTDIGDRILNILGDNYSAGKVFPQAEFDSLVVNFKARVAEFNGLLNKKDGGTLKGRDFVKLGIYFSGVVLAASLWGLPSLSKSDKDDTELPPVPPSPATPKVAPPSGGPNPVPSAPPHELPVPRPPETPPVNPNAPASVPAVTPPVSPTAPEAAPGVNEVQEIPGAEQI